MGYKIIKYKKRAECPFETYEPKRRLGVSKENTVPLIIRLGHEVSLLGGIVGFWASGALITFKSLFGIKDQIRNIRGHGKTIEFR